MRDVLFLTQNTDKLPVESLTSVFQWTETRARHRGEQAPSRPLSAFHIFQSRAVIIALGRPLSGCATAYTVKQTHYHCSHCVCFSSDTAHRLFRFAEMVSNSVTGINQVQYKLSSWHNLQHFVFNHKNVSFRKQKSG